MGILIWLPELSLSKKNEESGNENKRKEFEDLYVFKTPARLLV